MFRLAHGILKAVAKLADDPCPAASKKLIGSDDAFRLRVGDYRVVYTVYETHLVVQIVRLGHRRGIYRG